MNLKNPIANHCFRIFCAFAFFSKVHFSYAEHVLPIFSESWYTAAKPSAQVKVCHPEYEYTSLIYGTAKQVADQLIPASNDKECTWSDVKLDSELGLDYFPPDLFDFYNGNLEEWHQLRGMNQPGAEIWKRECWKINSKGDSYIAFVKSIKINPRYLCPKGSVYGRDTEALSVLGCTTQPAPCSADIVGRDLDES